MFTKKVIKESEILEERWRQKCSHWLGEDMPGRHTNRSGIELKPVYTPRDIEDIGFQEIALPGEYPFTRGKTPLQYQIMPLMMVPVSGYGGAEETRKRREWLSKLGSRLHVGKEGELAHLFIPADLPTQNGYDADAPEARGRVGHCGISISTVKDIEVLFEGLPLDKVFSICIPFDSTMAVTSLLAAYILDVRKEELEKLLMVGCNLLHHQLYWDSAGFPPGTAIRLETEYVKFIIENCPLATHTIATGYNPEEAGATPVQETALSLASTIGLMEECIKVGMDPDRVAPQFIYHPCIGLNLFEDIAKIRAARKLWAKIFKERFECKRPESLHWKWGLAQTSGFSFTAQEPLNNIIRATIMTLTGMLAGIDGCAVNSYDEAVGIPSEEAVKMSIRTYQILSEETDIPKVTDPLGGSYYIEWLTNRMEEEIRKFLDKIEEKGGFLKCWESGWLRGEVEKSAYERQKRFDEGKDVRVGVNKYKVGEETRIEAFRVSQEIEDSRVEMVRKHKVERDNTRTKVALSRVEEAAIRIDKEWPGSCGELMPALIESARSGATLGEMQGLLKKVFGYGYFSG